MNGPLRAAASLLLLLVLAVPAGADPLGRVEPRLLAAARGTSAPLHVWLELEDKGERSPEELATMLAAAEAALTPRSRARRIRAHVLPLVDERDLPVSERYLGELAARGLAPHAASRWLNRVAVTVPASRLGEIAALPFVRRVAPVEQAFRSFEQPPAEALKRTSAPPLKPRTPPVRDLGTRALDYGRLQTVMQQVQAFAFHDSGYTGAGVLVCLIDAGFNFHDTHEVLAGQVIAPGRTRDFVEGDTVVTEPAFFTLDHGTWVMGLIAGDLPGEYLGSAFGAEFALARTENSDAAFERPVEMLYWGMGAEWADSLGADIISSSLGYFQFNDGIGDYTYADMDGHTTDISRAAEIAASKGIMVVNAVGNEGQTAWRHLIAPADVHGDSLIAVGSVSTTGAPAAFTSAGPSADGRIKPDLAAAGIAVPIVNTNGNPASYTTNSGTSLSTPIVAGLAACLLEARPGWTPQQVIRALRETASRAFQPDNLSGYGVPNGRAALEWSPNGPNFHPPGRVGIALTGPNPWSPSTATLVVTFALGDAVPYPSAARLSVFDAGGRRVRTLWTGTLAPGRAERTFWDGRDDSGRPLGPAVFWVAVDAAGELASRRIVLLR